MPVDDNHRPSALAAALGRSFQGPTYQIQELKLAVTFGHLMEFIFGKIARNGRNVGRVFGQRAMLCVSW